MFDKLMYDRDEMPLTISQKCVMPENSFIKKISLIFTSFMIAETVGQINRHFGEQYSIKMFRNMHIKIFM